MVQESLFSFLFLRKNIDQRGKRICKIETILWSCICFLLCLGSWHTWENAWFHLWYDLGLEHAEDICIRPNRFNRYCSTNDTVEILIVDGVAAAIVAVIGYKGNKRKNLKAKTIHEARGTAWLNWNVLLGTRRRRNITSSSLAVYDSLLRFVNENWLTQKIATPIIEAVGRNDKKRVISVRIRTPQQMRKTEDCHRSGFLTLKREPPFSEWFPWKPLILLE